MAIYAVREGVVVKIADSTPTIPDIYFRRPYLDEQLSVGSAPILVRSRGHKAALMKQLGVREAGDRQRGSSLAPKISGKARLAAQTSAGMDRAFHQAREQLRRGGA